MLFKKIKNALFLSLLLPLMVSAAARDFSFSQRATCLALLMPLIGYQLTIGSEATSDIPAIELFEPYAAAEYGFRETLPNRIEEEEAKRQLYIKLATDASPSFLKRECIKYLMESDRIWHEGTSKTWLAIKKYLAHHADMRWFYMHQDEFLMNYATIVNISVNSLGCLACNSGCPVIAAGIWCCGLGTPLALRALEVRQRKPENFNAVLDWLSQNTTWQENLAQKRDVAAQTPRPMPRMALLD